MATYTEYPNGHKTAPLLMASASSPAVTTLSNTFDASRLALAAADVVEVLAVPAGTFVHKVFMEVVGAEDGTINVGDGADPDGYIVAGSTATAGARSMGAGALASGKFYADADTIDITVPANTDFSMLKVRLVASVTTIG